MMKLNLIFIFLLTLISCSQDLSRNPASDFTIDQSVIQSTFDIPKIELSSTGSSTWSSLASQSQQKLSNIEIVTGANNLKVVTLKESLPDNVAARLVPEVSDSGEFILRIFYSDNDDKSARTLVTSIVEKLTDKTKLQTYYDLFEWFYNIKEGHAESIEAFHRIKMQALDGLNIADSPDSIATLEKLNDRSSELEELTKSLKRERRLQEKARKDILSALDRAGDTEQLKSLVAAGKRAEVADLLEKYLPKEQMSPFEVKFWDQMLETIRNPLPLKDRVLVFRGIDEDMIYSALNDAGKELAKEDALSNSKAFMMSSMMTKNQGTWNRRLRSLQTMNEKFLGFNNKTMSSEWSQFFRISTFFKQHSRNPQGSPFLSFTPKISISTNFGRKRSAAYLVDPRALLANATTSYVGEFEFLTSLVTFPDELVDIYDKDLHGEMDNTQRQARFLEKTKARLIDEYGQVDGEKAYSDINKVFNHFNDFNDVAQLETNVKKQGFFSKIMSYFKKTPVEEVVENVDPTSKSCNYVLKTIWNL